MKIEHIGIWVSDLDSMVNFYIRYFDGKASETYHNPTKQFTSRFVLFESGCRLELMHNPCITTNPNVGNFIGITHLAVSVGSEEMVRKLTEQLRIDGYTIVSEPRTTGDGYYESAIRDPENNLIEITA